MIVTCNSAGCRILRFTPGDIIGHSAAEFFTGKNAWIVERIKSPRREGRERAMDAKSNSATGPSR